MPSDSGESVIQADVAEAPEPEVDAVGADADRPVSEAEAEAAADGPPVSPIDVAAAAIESRVEAFRGAVSTAEADVGTDLTRRTATQSFKEEQALIELGPFALGRINPDRFASLLGISEQPLTPDSLDVLERAHRVLADFSTSTSHRLAVPPRGDLRDTVKEGLARLGEAFGAARAVELARSGRFVPEEHGVLFGPLPFRLWHRGERELAPPLVVELRGDDCVPAGLGEFLDGRTTLVLVTSGPTTPAPLARLITPGTFVQQTADPSDLDRIASIEHPAVVLLFDEDRPEQAHFTHDPDAGASSWERLTVTRMPADTVVGRGRRPPTWLEELVHLRTLATAPATPGTAPPVDSGPARAAPSAEAPAAAALPPQTADATEADDSVDRLAAWLLAHTDVSDL